MIVMINVYYSYDKTLLQGTLLGINTKRLPFLSALHPSLKRARILGQQPFDVLILQSRLLDLKISRPMM